MSPGRCGRSTQSACGARARAGSSEIVSTLHIAATSLVRVGLGEPRQHRRDLVAGAGVERRRTRRGPSAVSAIRLWRASCRRRLAHDQPGVREAAQDAAEIAGVEPELLAELGRRDRVALRELVEHARLGQREPAVEQSFLQHADPPRVEAVETADPVDRFRRDVHGRAAPARRAAGFPRWLPE